MFFPSSYFPFNRGADQAVSGEGARLRGLPLQSITTKATKHASVNISVASATRPGSCCSLSAESSERGIVCPTADCFESCCWTWLACCGEAAVPACMLQQNRGLELMFLCFQLAAGHAPPPWHGKHNLHHLVLLTAEGQSRGF